MRLAWDILLLLAYVVGAIGVLFVLAVGAMVVIAGNSDEDIERRRYVSDQWEWDYMPVDLKVLREKRLKELNKRAGNRG